MHDDVVVAFKESLFFRYTYQSIGASLVAQMQVKNLPATQSSLGNQGSVPVGNIPEEGIAAHPSLLPPILA